MLLKMTRLVLVRTYASANYLLASLPKKTPVPSPAKAAPPTDLSGAVITPTDLNVYFHDADYGKPTAAHLARSDLLFSRAHFSHEWTCARWEDIPDIKVELLQRERKAKLDSVEPLKRTAYHASLEESRTSFGVDPAWLAPLPEVLLLGHTNAGKSTLINSLFMATNQARTAKGGPEYAFVLRRAGFTQCLNCYNVGNKLRVVDSPGYGEFGEDTQGQVVLDYIRQRKQLRRTFVLVDSMAGVRDEDATLIEHLIEHGAPFELVFTKVDAVVQKHFPKVDLRPARGDAAARAYELVREGNSRVVGYYQQLVADAGLAELATLPRMLFNNLVVSKYLGRRLGYREIRYAILESCGLVEAPPVQPIQQVPIQEHPIQEQPFQEQVPAPGRRKNKRRPTVG